MKSNAVVAWLARTLVGLLLIDASPIAAQNIQRPPRHDTQSSTGVSYRTLSFNLSDRDLAIGGEDNKGLALDRIYISNMFASADVFPPSIGWTHNFMSSVTNDTVPTYPDQEPPQFPTWLYHVNIGSKSYAFTGPRETPWGGGYGSISKDGVQLVYNGTNYQGYYTLTEADGSVINFTPGLMNAKVKDWTFPDGTRWDFTYDISARLKSVFSNRGYALLFDRPTMVCAVNLAETYVTPTSSCPSGAQSVTFTYQQATMNWATQYLMSATKAGETTSYTYSAFDHLTCVKDPGQTQCRITNTYGSCPLDPQDPSLQLGRRYKDPVIAQQTGTGETFSYATTQTACEPMHASDPNYFPWLSNETTVTANDASSIKVGVGTGGMSWGVRDQLNRTTGIGYELALTTMPTETVVVESVTNPEGDHTLYTNDGRGNILQAVRKAKSGSGLADIVTTASYPASCANAKTCNKPDHVVDARGNRTDYTYDATHGGILTETRPAGPNGVRPQKRYSYTQLHAWVKDSGGGFVPASSPVWLLTGTSECQTLASCAGTADEIKTTITYGAAGVANNLLPTVETIGSGDGVLVATTAKTYDFQGNVLTVDGPLAGTADTVRYRYDARRRVTGVIGADPDGAGALKHRATRNTYDAGGALTKIEQGTVNSPSDGDWAAFAALETVETAYDVMDRKLREWRYGTSGGTQSLTQYSYDAVGRLECTAVRMNPAVYASLPLSACSLGTQGSAGPDRITRLVHDAAGQIVKTQLAYGTADQSDEETNTYSNNGKLASVADGEGNRTTYEYDGHDRLLKTWFPLPSTPGSSSTTDYEQLTYDANGNVTQRRLRDGNLIGYAYDALDRMTFKDRPNTAWIETDITYSHDLLGRLTQAADSWPHPLTFTYDALGRRTSETSPWVGSLSWAYDAAGRRTRLTWTDGLYVTYEHLVTGEVSAIRESGTTLLGAYAYDDLGRRTTLSRGNGVVTAYGYDPVSRLSSLSHVINGSSYWDVTTTFTYNPASQIATSTRNHDGYAWNGHYNVDRPYAVNGLNQLTAAGATSLGYDGRGNLTGSGSSTYTYGADNLLATGPGAGFVYDSLDRLFHATAQGLNLRYDGAQLGVEHEASTSVILRRYVHGPGTDEPLVWYEGSGTSDRRWLIADERGSIVAVTNVSGGVLSGGINTYDEYGIPAATNLGRFQYTGQAWLPELGMYYYKARIYSPTLGRFLQTDPTGYDDGINWYAYVGNDPVNATDPDGQVAWFIPLAIFVGKEIAGELFERKTGLPAPTIKGVGRRIARESAGRAAARARMAANAAQGARGEAATAAKLGDSVAGRRVTIESSTTGRRSVTDFVTKEKGVVESKTGSSSLSPGQRDVKADIDAGRSVIPRGRNAVGAGLKPNVPTKMSCYKIDRCNP